MRRQWLADHPFHDLAGLERGALIDLIDQGEGRDRDGGGRRPLPRELGDGGPAIQRDERDVLRLQVEDRRIGERSKAAQCALRGDRIAA